MKKSPIVIMLLFFIILSIGLIASGCSKDVTEDVEQKEEATVIKIGAAPYNYEVPMRTVTRQIAEERGYEVEVMEGEVGFLYLSLVQNDIDIWPGVWLPSLHETYHDKYEDDYELGSIIYTSILSGLVVPEYVEMDSLAELKGNEDLFNYKVIGFEPGSGMMLKAESFIEDYNLDLELVSGTTSSMLAEVDYATSQKEPILFLGWRPHAMFLNYDLKGLEDPDEYWKRDDYYWGISKEFKEKAPDMYNYVKKFSMSVEDTEAFLYGIDEGEDIEEMAAKWIEDNRADIDEWLKE